ncbi:MAG: hypothetical protein IMY72_13125 [Bacteroidetes bacterium]|nr:hypothetical protein [Bacteroidota bacterium]
MLLSIIACNQNAKKGNCEDENQIKKSGKLEVKAEIEKWKKELLEKKLIGNPCYFRKTHDSTDCINWYENNPDQQDGLPFDDKMIKSVCHDFNNDKKEDFLLYFMSENCTGHNGGAKTYATIIYSNNISNSDLMNEIIRAILSEYKQMMRVDKNLKEITDAYLESTTTIDAYKNGIIGQFRLYTKEDPHCCPSYTGNYTYQVENKSMMIEISKK